MDMQFELFGGVPPAEAASARALAHRYYFTLVPPPAVAQAVERAAMLLARRYGARNPVRAERLHVSLHRVQLGREIDADLLDDALAAGAAIRRPGFDIAFDQVRTFARERPNTG